jgi:predicted transcriptional regulator
MSTTTIRIDDELKARVAAAAARAGKTSHGFILDAIASTVEQAEREEDFHRVADERWAEILATGETIPWDEMRGYLEGRLRGEQPRRPDSRKLARGSK